MPPRIKRPSKRDQTMLAATEFARCDSLIVTAYANLAEAVSWLQRAKIVDQTLEARQHAKADAMAQIDCLASHFKAALDAIPDEYKMPQA